MNLNFDFKQQDKMNQLNGRNVLLYGPANSNIEKDIKKFSKYDFIILNNNMINLVKEYIQDLDKQSYKIIRVFNGRFTKGNKQDIIDNDKYTFFYWVSEVHTFHVMDSYGIDKGKVMHMANNYRNFGFDACPTMGPKMLMFLQFYNYKFKSLKLTGLTFYMDFDNKTSNYNNSYHEPYYYELRYDTFKELEECKSMDPNNLTDEDKMILENLETRKNLQNNNLKIDHPHQNIYQGWNMFLYFLKDCHDKNKKIILDKPLLNILNKYPNKLYKDPI